MRASAPLFTPLAASLADMLVGLDIGEAERIIEAARRVLWTQHFTGHPMADVAFGLSAPETSLRIAESCTKAARGALLGAEEVLLELRLSVYAGAFAGQLNTRFGEAFNGRVEAMLAADVEQARFAKGGRLNG